MRIRKFWLEIWFFSGLLVGCVGRPPVDDYVYAHVAIQYAGNVNSQKYAPGFFGYAEQYYRQAQKNFADREYAEARANFGRAKYYAEKAENYTVLKKAQTGDSE